MESENMFMKRKGISAFFSCALFGISALLFGGTALAATAPMVSTLKFDKGTPDLLDDTTALSAGWMSIRVAADSMGNAYVTDTELNTIYIYNNKGLLVRGLSTVHLPIGIAVGSDGKMYVGGVLNGRYNIFVIDQAGVVQGSLSGWTGAMPLDIEIDLQGNIIGLERDGGRVVLLDRDGLLLNTFGPYLERYDSDPDASLSVRTRTRHRLVPAGGIAVSPSGDIYLSIRESVDYLTNTTSSAGCYSNGQAAFYEDPNGWKDYASLANIDGKESYKYWCPVASRGAIAVIDRNGKNIKTKVGIDAAYVLASSYTGDAVELSPVGLALDGKERLYVATTAGIKVYDAASISILTPDGSFEGGAYKDVAFDAVSGRLFGAKSGSNMVIAYGIDGGTNPANSAPAEPSPDSPIGSVCVDSRTPGLTVKNSNDPNFDPIIYGYEVKDSSGALATNATGIAEGTNGKTSMALSVPLTENATYSWRAQAFDGYAAAWSDWAVFRVNEGNDDPTVPKAVSPINNAAISPFSSSNSLTWNSSTDPDSACGDYVKEYIVEVAGEGFSKTFTTTAISLSVGDISGLKNGNAYTWRVKAVDNYGGVSDWSAESFTYRTTVVKFESDQPNTKVYIDGNYGYLGRLVGNAPREVEGISPGSHFVTFVKAGYEPYHTIVTVKDPLAEVTEPVIAQMVKASRIKPAATGETIKDSSSGDINIAANSTPFVVDFNNDGLKDIIAGGKLNVYNDSGELVDEIDGRVYLFIAGKQIQEDGTKKVVLIDSGALKADSLDINVGSRAVPFVVDYDNDGRKDLMVGSGDGFIYLYLNTGAENDPVFAQAGTVKDSSGLDIKVMNSAPFVVDYNNDGRKDLVVGSIDGQLRLYKNRVRNPSSPEIDDASPEFDAAYETISALDAGLNAAELNVGSNSKLFFTDWNSDGKKDLVVGRGVADSGGNTVNLFLNVGTDDAPSFVTISGLQNWIKGKKRERGNREFIPYLGYSEDLGDLTAGNGEASPFVVNWDDSSARDLLAGNGTGGVVVYKVPVNQ